MTGEEIQQRLQNGLGLKLAVGLLVVLLGSAVLGTVQMSRQFTALKLTAAKSEQVSVLQTKIDSLSGRLDRMDNRTEQRIKTLSQRMEKIMNRVRKVEQK